LVTRLNLFPTLIDYLVGIVGQGTVNASNSSRADAGLGRMGQTLHGPFVHWADPYRTVRVAQTRTEIQIWPGEPVNTETEPEISALDRINDGPIRFLMARSCRKGASDARHKKHYRGQTTHDVRNLHPIRRHPLQAGTISC